MRWWFGVQLRLRSLLRRGAVEQELDEEFQYHLERQIEQNISRGLDPEEARFAALRSLDGRTQRQEECRDARGINLLADAARDLRYGMRMLRLNPVFTVVALLTIAIGIGANTAVFSVVNSVLLKPLAYPKAEELVAVRQAAPGAAGLANFVDNLRLSPSMYFTYAEQNQSFQALGVWIPGEVSVTGMAEPEQVHAVWVSEGTLEVLGVQPEMGRWLNRADQTPGAPEAVMLSYGFWQRHFGGDRSVIGRGIMVESRPREIAGVMPRGFRFVNTEADVILPLRFDRRKAVLAGFGYQGIARLKPGVTIKEANADISRMLPIWMNSWSNGPGTNPHIYETWRIKPALRPLKQEVIGNIGNVLWIVMGTIGIVMLIACANVANLLLVRAAARQQELAIRAALGAGWGRIARELLVESGLLALLGGALGIGLAYGGLQLLVAMGPANLPRLSEISLDGRALVFTLVLSLLSGLLFGLIPALKYAGPRTSLALRSGGRTSSTSREHHRARSLLVVAQVAMALVLLVSSGLMIRTFLALRTVDPGFTHAEHLETMRIAIPPSLVPDKLQVTRMQNNLADRLAAIPGVTSVGFSSGLPMEGAEPDWDAIVAEGKSYSTDEIPPLRLFKHVSPGFFHTIGTRMIAGRELSWNDIYGSRPVLMVSENLARELWGSPNAALGKRIRELKQWFEVIGVVQDVRENGVHEPAPAIVYWPILVGDNFGSARAVTFAIRSDRAGTEGFLNQIRQAVWSVNPSLPVASVRTMRDIYDESLGRTSFTLVMLGIAGAMALLLGLVGIYGVISYSVSQRRREIGIRLALGAQPGELMRMFVRHGLTLVGIGVAIGLVAAVGLMRLIKSLLFGISPLDPVTYAAVPVILAAAAVVASYLPARRAAAVDPTDTLRAE
jgi:predicted permease